MNGKDFDDMCKNNREYYAREQAKLDHIYEQERARLLQQSAPKPAPPMAAAIGGNVAARLDRIEARIDKLYEMLGDPQGGRGSLVVAPPNAKIMADRAVTLTDSQFKELMKRIFGD